MLIRDNTFDVDVWDVFYYKYKVHILFTLKNTVLNN